MLNIDSGYESATFTDESKVNELVFDYTKFYDLMFNANIEINNTLLIGGAGYSYPKYYISHYPNKTMDNDEQFKRFSFPKGTLQCPCCGINIEWN